MTGPCINEETPPGIELHATPRNAVTGTSDPACPCRTWPTSSLRPGSLRAPGTSSGGGGAAFLGQLGNWFTRTLSEGLTEARESLESGATLVGVFQVADPDSKAIGKTLTDAGVESLHYFGSWTYT